MAKNKDFLKTRRAAAVLAAGSLVAAWFLFIRAVDTGSLQQYAMLIILVVFGINRLVRAVYPAKQ